MRHTAQDMVMKDGKERVVWDGSTNFDPLDVVINDYTPTENEPEVTFGTAKNSFYWLIYNLRVSYPELPILLALADIKAFGFLVANLYCLAIAMIFRSNTSAACSISAELLRHCQKGLPTVQN